MLKGLLRVLSRDRPTVGDDENQPDIKIQELRQANAELKRQMSMDAERLRLLQAVAGRGNHSRKT